MKPHLIILGAPGSGKGTQAAGLVKAGYCHVSTGDLLRAEIAKDSELGRRVSGILSRGELVGDSVVLELLKANCDTRSKGYIFDGFPRNVAQAEMLDRELLAGSSWIAVYFKIDLDVLLERIVNRRTCSNCSEIYNLVSKRPVKEGTCDRCGASGSLVQRKDDTKEVLKKRLDVFSNEIESLIKFYKSKNYVEVDASREPEEIYKALMEAIAN